MVELIKRYLETEKQSASGHYQRSRLEIGDWGNREIKFFINVIPSTASISQAPYRMAPTELKELKTQL